MVFQALFLFLSFFGFFSFSMAGDFNSCLEMFEHNGEENLAKNLGPISRLYEHREKRHLINKDDLEKAIKFYEKLKKGPNITKEFSVEFTKFIMTIGKFNEIAIKLDICYRFHNINLKYLFRNNGESFDDMLDHIKKYENGDLEEQIVKIAQKKEKIRQREIELQKDLDSWLNTLNHTNYDQF